MLKTQYLVIGVALIAGTSLGWLDIFRFSGKAEGAVGAGAVSFRSESAPFFGRVQAKKDITQISPTRANLGVLISLYAEMSGEELIAEIKRLNELSKNGQRFDDDNIYFLVQYLNFKLGRDFPGEVRSWIDAGRVNHNGLLLQGWARNDFDGAMKYFLENKENIEFSIYTFRDMVRKWTGDQPEKAVEWMLAQTGKARQEALALMLDVLAEKHPLLMEGLVSKLLPEDLKKSEALSTIAKNWGSCDSVAALRWADTLSGKQKKEAIVEILGGLSSQKLDQATEEFKKRSAELQGYIAQAIVETLYSKDNQFIITEENRDKGKKQALEWLLSNRPDSDNTGQLAKNVLASGGGEWTPGFIDYVQKMQDGAVKDNALSYLVDTRTLSSFDENHTYEQVFSLIDRIKDPTIKKESTYILMGKWISNDPNAARLWIEEKSGFSGEDKQKQLDECDWALKRKKEAAAKKTDHSGVTSMINRWDHVVWDRNIYIMQPSPDSICYVAL